LMSVVTTKWLSRNSALLCLVYVCFYSSYRVIHNLLVFD
jgi:hypothetical protein